MYLKKIEIQGFKSFADKTIVNFNDNITAIVGPNGSGKSNISDAIRWVLGEQSVKNLRGSKMEDIIFSGTDKRKALGYAEVSIYFNNKDGFIPIEYTEVCVTRRMFRSGESEYYINKNSCRLKDIRELFMDTGIGKDGYSIIGQGKIEEILSNRPEDRRNIFEEAAGIVKYKNKKIETEKKLGKTDENLNRIKDIIFEITNQYKILEEEAKKTKEYKEIYHKLKEVEINLYLNKIYDLEEEKNVLTDNIENINRNIALLMVDKNHIEGSFNKLKEGIERIEKNIDDLQGKKNEITKQMDSNINKSKLLEEKMIYINKDLDRLEKEIKNSNFEIGKYRENIDKIQLEKKEVSSQINKIYKEYEVKNIELEKINVYLKDEVNKLESKKIDLFNFKNSISDLKSQKNSLISFKNNIDKRIYQINKDKEECVRSKEEIVNSENKLNKIKFEKENELKAIESKTENIIREIEDQKNIIKEIELEENQYKIKLQGLKSTFNLYKNMENSYEGYYKSVKNLLKAIDKKNVDETGFKGVVGELIKVDKKYERAIEISLGNNIQNIITDTSEDAKKFIEYLKGNNLGRVTFLPINTIKANALNINIEEIKEYGVLGLADSLIDYPSRYENIFKNLLGKTIIVDNIDNAIKLAKKFNNRHRIVTLEGEVFNPGGSLTGGSTQSNSASIISRKNKIEELEKEIKFLEVDINKKIIDREYTIEELKKLKCIKEGLEEKRESTRLELINTNNSILACSKEISRLDSEIENKKLESKNLTDELDNFSSQNIEIDQEILINMEKIKVLESLIGERKNKIELENINKDILSKEMLEIKINLNTMENNLRVLDENFKNTVNLVEKEIGKVEEKKQQQNKNIQDVNSIKNDISILSSEISKEEEKELHFAEKLIGEKKQKEILMENFYKEQEILKKINDKLMISEKEKKNLEIKLSKGDVELEILNTKLWEEYEINFQDSKDYKKPIENISIVQKKISEYKRSIKKIGTINLNAEEDFKNIKERYDFITGQQEDLIKSKKDLIKLIKDIEKTMRIKFLESFENINSSFKDVFYILFNGGKASLELVDKEDVLNSGIEIKVQPPGKKLQNLNLLSGGEKSLTAVALLFGILETKPSPFCILDEIDAALDEANIGRYTSYLDKFSKQTQFVLITHRKTTMEICHVLYGVTMAEEGVSKLVSLKMNEFKK